MTIEDIIEYMSKNFDNFYTIDNGKKIYIFPDPWYRNFIDNVAEHTFDAKPLSSEQSKIIIRLANKCKEFLPNDIANDLKNSRYRKPPYQSSNIPKEVRYVGENKLAFRFKYNEEIIKGIKTLKSRSVFTSIDDYPFFHRQLRIWIVSVNTDNINRIMSFITKHRFNIDNEVVEYLTLAENSKGEKSHFICDDDNIIINITDNIILNNWMKYILKADIL